MRKSTAFTIKSTKIEIGDLIRVTGKHSDADVTIVGQVAKRWHSPGRTTFYETKEGVELLAVHPDGTQTRGMSVVTRIALLNRNPAMPPPLF